MIHPNSKMVSAVLNTLLMQSEDESKVYRTVNDFCPNLTVCPECRIDDFCHIEAETEDDYCTPVEEALGYIEEIKEEQSKTSLIEELTQVTYEIAKLSKRVENIKRILNEAQEESENQE
jgi:hypothetical protein